LNNDRHLQGPNKYRIGGDDRYSFEFDFFVRRTSDTTLIVPTCGPASARAGPKLMIANTYADTSATGSGSCML
jgi:hypothetical protein